MKLAQLFFVLTLAMSLHADQFDTLRLYWQTNLINNGSSPSSVASTANSYWSSMSTSPTRTYLWSDLPFGSVSANIVSTYDRLQAMALAWATPGSSLQNNAGLAAAVAGGLDWMNTNVYTTTATEYNNWFHWEDSGPQALNNTEVLLYPYLTGTQISNYCAAVDHYSPVGYPANAATFGWMTGANTADKVLVVGIRGILGKSASLVTTATNNLSPVFAYVTSSDGFYRDGSFVFHGNIAYNGHYGLVLLGDIPTIVDLFQGSPWQITDTGLTNVYNWVFNSFEPFIYHGVMMDMVRGRIVSWSYETASGDGSGAISAARQIAQFAPASTATALNNWANSPQLPPGQFHFPAIDRVVALRTGFGFGISMSSSRIANYESINSGNLHGWFTGDGMTYLYLGNSESQFASDFWPSVDPYHLPGTTVETNSHANSAGEAQTTDQNWVGGAQVKSTYGIAGMSLHSWSTSLTGRKSWFMLDNEIVCLGAGITCGGPAEVHTTAENRRLGSPIANTFTLNGKSITPTLGWSTNLSGATPSWCALSGVGGYYFPAGSTNLQAGFLATSGKWSDINSGDDSTTYTDNYLKLWFNHGLLPTNAAYAYVILPNFSTTSVSNYALNPDILILTNTPFMQAVKKMSLGIVAANFWTNGTHTADLVSVNNKASVITLESSNSIAVGLSNPTQTNSGAITVTLNRSATGTIAADPGVTVVQLSPQIIFSVNVSGSHGQTFQASFAYSNSILPALNNVTPAGAGLFQSTNMLAFNAVSAVGILSSNISVTLNGVLATNLAFNGSTTNWNVGVPLIPNTVYTAVITATDLNGYVVSTTKSFDTFSSANYIWEAEDYDYGGGHYIDNFQTNAYAGLNVVTNVDTRQVNFAGTFLYRPSGMDSEINGDTIRPAYNGTGHSDYSIGYFSAGAWANYTRHYPAGSYNVYARLAAGGGATTCTFYRVTGGWGTTNQTTNLLGTFSVSNNGWENYNYIPLNDSLGNLVTVNLTGPTNTLRLARPTTAAADCNANFLMLVPVFGANAFPSGTNITITFPSQSGFNYQVQYKNNLGDASWNPLLDIAGDNTAKSVNDPAINTARFYRVQIH
ncbi:MAG TPA: polysaccharide lyase family 8 super-sandwich domain-containing protein [Verrucomicrobiae bacterium]|nr:polysaccharide lyase family 8 super-sandwich domain-containing protein [Verrucomicrobiae bacterium]